METIPLASVLVCTRNRRDNVVPTIRSITECGHPSFEIIVLDQSDDDVTQHAVARAFGSDARVRLLRLSRAGKPMALNEGLREAKGRYLLLTDDDCEVIPGWIAEMERAFADHPRIGCVYGSVEAAPHDAAQGYIPARTITRLHYIERLDEFLVMPGWENYGMGANMAFRIDALRAIEGWDDCIGPGAKFGSGDDNDVAVRILSAGYGIGFCPSSRVIHYGFRLWKSIRRDLGRRGFGLGAVVAKHVRLGVGFPGGLRAVRYEAGQCAARLLRGERPRGVAFVAGWVRGFVAGLRQPIDRRASRFISVDSPRDHVEQVAEVVLRADLGSSSSGR
jgi:glycosyltransferase involved in cell wall biosynthesis